MNHAGERTCSSGPQPSVKPQISNNPLWTRASDTGVPGTPSQGVNPLVAGSRGGPEDRGKGLPGTAGAVAILPVIQNYFNN